MPGRCARWCTPLVGRASAHGRPSHGGQSLVAQVGVGVGTDLGKLGKGDAVLIIASATSKKKRPIWRLRLKQAHDRGAYVVVANARHTRMDDFSSEQRALSCGQGR